MGKDKREYFAGANTRNGFASRFTETLGGRFKRVYILKGSAGCGKSTFMKRVGERALREGYAAEYIRCSADKKSLDGVLIPALGVAVIDGTAPHVMDTKYPGARESIINLGVFWDEEKLKESREEIIAITDKKSLCYENAYRALAAAGSIRDIRASLTESVLLEDKLASFAARLCAKILKPGGNRADTFMQSSFSSEGYFTLPTFSDSGGVLLIRDKHDIAPRLLSLIENHAEKTGADRIISRDPVDPSKIEAIYLTGSDLLITTDSRYYGAAPESGHKPVNTARFIDKKAYSLLRVKDRAVYKLYNSLLASAKDCFTEAKDLHERLERIYIMSMAFAGLTDFTNKFIGEIFG